VTLVCFAHLRLTAESSVCVDRLRVSPVDRSVLEECLRKETKYYLRVQWASGLWLLRASYAVCVVWEREIRNIISGFVCE